MGYRTPPIPQTSPNSGRTFFGAGASGAPAPVNHLQEGPVTEQGDSGPGFYQTRGTGNKSGRVSPKQQLRGSARDLTLAHHGLIDAGAADPNQGQLFNADKTVGPRRSNADIIKDTGGNMPTGIDVKAGTKKDPGKINTLKFGAAPGYMPNLNNKQKVAALSSVAEGRATSGTDRGTGAATAEVTQDRNTARNKAGNQAWYGGVDSSGQHDQSVPGMASEAINQRASRSGVSGASMTRAAALTSPQSAWDINKQGSPDHRMPNLNHAEGVVQATEIAKPHVTRDEAVQIGSEIQTADGGLPSMGAKAAGVHFDKGNDTSSNIQVGNAKSLKAPNFEASLRLTGGGSQSGSRAIQRQAAESFTVDRHDANAGGIGPSKVLETRGGVYDVMAMTGSRVAHKNRNLPPNEQAREWVGQRGVNQAEGKHQGMVKPGPAMGLTPEAHQPSVNTAAQSRAQRRGLNTAERLGIDF